MPVRPVATSMAPLVYIGILWVPTSTYGVSGIYNSEKYRIVTNVVQRSETNAFELWLGPILISHILVQWCTMCVCPLTLQASNTTPSGVLEDLCIELEYT